MPEPTDPQPIRIPEDQWMSDLRVEVANLQVSINTFLGAEFGKGIANKMSDYDAEKMKDAVERLKQINADIEYIILDSNSE